MKTQLERLRNLNKIRTNQLSKIGSMVKKITDQAEAAERAARELQEQKE